MQTYNYTGSYFEITTEEPLGDEGLLSGSYGDLHFRRCSDGLAVIDSSFPGSGFVCWPTSADLGFPKTVNGIPVTEIRQKVPLSSKYPVVIEGGSLKRAYLEVSQQSLEEQMKQADSALNALILYMLRDQENVNQNERFTEIEIQFCNAERGVEFCEIRCGNKCILRNGVDASDLRVIAPSVILSGNASDRLEHAYFSGKVYPYTDYAWGCDFPDTDHFAGKKNLRTVDGSLWGDNCWSFRNCTSLESVHLSNGIRRIPPHSFENCSSLRDLYVPDTVTEIGEYAFSGCSDMETIHLPSDIRVIAKGLFKNCSSLRKVFLSDTIEVIENEAFAGCTVLRKPWIPKNIKEIGETAFDNPAW